MKTKKQIFEILIEQDNNNIYIATVPQLPGCHTQAENLSQLYERIQEAILLYIETQKELGNKVKTQHNRFVGFQQLEIVV
jgi:predicted RNase H-like HicB family nuclease